MHPLLLAAGSPRLRRWAIATAVTVATVGVLACGLVLLVVTAVTSANASTQATAPAGSSCSTTDVDTAGPGVGLSGEQARNAAGIIDTGQRLGVPAHGWVVAIATALAESGLRNLDHGDRDSLGLFQQRPSQGWGTPAEVTDPDHAATSFYRRLVAVPEWETLPVTVAAQTVQRSAHPNIYARFEDQAHRIIATCTPAQAEHGQVDGFAWPAAGPVTSGFGMRWGRLHAGIDIGAATGTPIYAAAAGTVTYAGPMGAYGTTVTIDHGNRTSTLYAHQTRLATVSGAPVAQGDLIGYVGSTGRSTGPHLHFEIRVDGAATDPRHHLPPR